MRGHTSDSPRTTVYRGRLTYLLPSLLFFPAVLLALNGWRTTGEARQVYLIGAGFQLLICMSGLVTRVFQRQPISYALILLYGLGLAWMFIGKGAQDWFFHLSQAFFLVVPLLALSMQTLTDLGAPALRRSRALTRRLEARRDWPKELDACRRLPEVKALREALYLDATPALELLHHPRPEVQIAALTALEYRTRWYPGQADLILQVAIRARQPEVRAAALAALANVEDRYVIESLGEHLRDPSPIVRRAAMEALLWDSELRWPWLRHAIRRCLADPICANDGPIRCEGAVLTPLAVDDLRAWSSEAGVIGLRSARSLATHYHQVLLENRASESHLAEILAQARDANAPAMLRVDLARVLRKHNALTEEVLLELLGTGNPTTLRLLAAEGLLTEGESEEAEATLRELARTANREIALATALVVQRCLEIDFGLVPDQPLPALHTRQAAEVSRRVMTWASQEDSLTRASHQGTRSVPPSPATRAPAPTSGMSDQ